MFMNIFAYLIIVKTISSGSQLLHTSHLNFFFMFTAKKQKTFWMKSFISRCREWSILLSVSKFGVDEWFLIETYFFFFQMVPSCYKQLLSLASPFLVFAQTSNLNAAELFQNMSIGI